VRSLDRFHRRLHKLEKLVSDPYLLYLANKNMLKLKTISQISMYYAETRADTSGYELFTLFDIEILQKLQFLNNYDRQ
jgi:hypothetical protein